MKIHTLTATGIDEKTNLEQLIQINKAFPFMEWGVSFSKNSSSNRYPSMEFVEEKILPLSHELHLAAHLCGNIVNLFIEQDKEFLNILSHFGRVQINVASKNMTKTKREKLIHAISQYQGQLILQESSSNEDLNQQLRKFFHVAYLFDKSGGKGISPDTWPEYLQNSYCGYAGGLSHLNLNSQIVAIEEKAGNNYIWLDMEGQIRTNEDWFDLEKIRKAAHIVSEYQQKKLKLDI